MLHYMLSLKEWFGPNVWNSMPVAKTAASFLHDFHASPYILDYSPSDIAICCLLLTFQIYGIQVPLTDDFDENGVWYRVRWASAGFHLFINVWCLTELYQVFSKSLTKEMAWQIIEKIMDVYNNDTQNGNWGECGLGYSRETSSLIFVIRTDVENWSWGVSRCWKNDNWRFTHTHTLLVRDSRSVKILNFRLYLHFLL